MAYSAQSFYRPGVMPDTQGLGPGIAGAAGAISGALGTYAGWKRDDVVRADQQQFTIGRDEARMGHESAMIDKRMDRDLTMFGMEQDAVKQQREMEKAMAEETMRYANAGRMGGLQMLGATPDMIEAAMRLPEKARGEFLDAATATLLKRQEQAMKLQQAALEKMLNEGSRDPRMIPIRNEKGEPTGYGVPYDGGKLLGGAMHEQARPPLAAAGKPPSLQLREIEIEPGVKAPYIFDPSTGKMEPAQTQRQNASGGPAPAPGNAIQSLLNARQR